jgi:hypothetical protein
MAAIRLRWDWWSGLRPLYRQRQGRVSQPLAINKRLLDPDCAAFRQLWRIRRRLQRFWNAYSLPYPQPGVRLVRQQDVLAFVVEARTAQTLLASAVEQLNAQRGALKARAEQRLGRLYDACDYPASWVGLFAIRYEFPSVEPATYLRVLQPELFQQEYARVLGEFRSAVELAENLFVGQLHRLASNWLAQLREEVPEPTAAGYERTTLGLRTFFRRFALLDVGSSTNLSALVHRVQKLVGDCESDQTCHSASGRARIARALLEILACLEAWPETHDRLVESQRLTSEADIPIP